MKALTRSDVLTWSISTATTAGELQGRRLKAFGAEWLHEIEREE
jgi:hypothetical protein